LAREFKGKGECGYACVDVWCGVWQCLTVTFTVALITSRHTCMG
jgi:predicted branched-subunit amino acid permease